MISNQLFSLPEDSTTHHCSIFNQLLHHYSHPEPTPIDVEQPLFEIQEFPIQEQEIKNHHKTSGEWVWADDLQFQQQYQNSQQQFKDQTMTTDNLQLKRVKSLRIEQEDKITLFLKKQSALSIQDPPIEEDHEEPERPFRSPQKRSTLVTKSQSLSPRKCKSKKIDKIKPFKLI